MVQYDIVFTGASGALRHMRRAASLATVRAEVDAVLSKSKPGAKADIFVGAEIVETRHKPNG